MREARLFFCTGRPLQPHDTSDLSGLDVAIRWIQIPPQIRKDIGLPTQLRSYTAFVSHFGTNGEEAGDDDPENPPPLPEFVPDADGCDHELPDGVTIKVRMQRFRTSSGATAYQPQWCHIAVYAASVYACICTIVVVSPILSLGLPPHGLSLFIQVYIYI